MKILSLANPARCLLLLCALAIPSGCSSPEAEPAAKPSPAAPTGFVPPRYSPIVGGSGENLAYDRAADSIHPKLTEHSGKMKQHIYRAADNIYSAVGFGLANMILIEGSDGVVIVDPLESEESAAAAFRELRKITDKPVKAIIYTHNHYDHVMGAPAVVDVEDVRSGRVPIYAHERLMDGLLHQLSVVGEAIGTRSLYTFGAFLDKGPQGSVNEGIGPTLVTGTASFVPPTRTFADRLDVAIAGLELTLLHAPSETDDEIVIWIPTSRALLSAEVIQGESFPNLYTLRGTTYRDPVAWYRTIDRLRALQPEFLVPNHGRPVQGRAEVSSLLTAYRDAIQFTHDQTVRLMNKGYTPDEIAAALPALPAHLAAHPWVMELYGTVKHSVRNIYNGYLGWFQGDPTGLDPFPPHQRAERYVQLMGGRDAVLQAAREAQNKGELQWSAELLTYLIRVDPEDQAARELKARALRELGFRQLNINWRNFYLTAALELEDKLDLSRFDQERGLQIFSHLPLVHLLENLPPRIDPERTRDVHMTLGVQLSDVQEPYALEIRRGIVQLHRGNELPRADVTLHTSEAVLRRILLRQTHFLKEWAMQRIRVDGSLADVSRFFDYFDPPSAEPPRIVRR